MRVSAGAFRARTDPKKGTAMALKDVEIRALKPGDRVYKFTDSNGLYVEVHPNGSKLWRYKFSHLGKGKRIALRRHPDVGLTEARRKRDDARRKLQDGIDPARGRPPRKRTPERKDSWVLISGPDRVWRLRKPRSDS